MDNEKAVEGLVSSSISPLVERVITKKLTQILDVAVKHEREKQAAAEARIAELEERVESRSSRNETDCDRIAALEKALEPFAREIPHSAGGRPIKCGVRDDNGWWFTAKFGVSNLRRAAALLKEKK